MSWNLQGERDFEASQSRPAWGGGGHWGPPGGRSRGQGRGGQRMPDGAVGGCLPDLKDRCPAKAEGAEPAGVCFRLG